MPAVLSAVSGIACPKRRSCRDRAGSQAFRSMPVLVDGGRPARLLLAGTTENAGKMPAVQSAAIRTIRLAADACRSTERNGRPEGSGPCSQGPRASRPHAIGWDDGECGQDARGPKRRHPNYPSRCGCVSQCGTVVRRAADRTPKDRGRPARMRLVERPSSAIKKPMDLSSPDRVPAHDR